MATDSFKDPVRSEAASPPLKTRSAASPLEGLVRLLARRAAREVVVYGLDKTQTRVNPAAGALSAKK
jgi:hypothetical protein